MLVNQYVVYCHKCTLNKLYCVQRLDGQRSNESVEYKALFTQLQ